MYDNFLITRKKRERERETSANTKNAEEKPLFPRGGEHAFGEFGTSARVKRALIRAIIAVVTNQLHLGSIPQKPTKQPNNGNNLLRNLHLHGTEENCR